MSWMSIAAWALWAALQSPPGDEDPESCKKALQAFRDGYKRGQESDRAAAVAGLTNHPCPKAVDLLAPLLTSETDLVRVAAANVLGTLDNPKAVEVLSAALEPSVGRHEALEALAKALERLDWEASAERLHPLLSKHHDKAVLDTLHVVVPVLGKLGSAGSVEPLLRLLEHAENDGMNTRVGGRRIAGNRQMAALEAPVRKALSDITGGNEPTSDKWEAWWKANRERLQANAMITYRCRTTGKRWIQKPGEAQECPFHDNEAKDGLVVKQLLGKSRP